MCIALEWRKVFEAIKASIKLMKEKPELNHNSNVATYGMAAKVPDQGFIDNLLKIYIACNLDTL
jgi:hypothetical protein